ncbi:uncharacterized protein [Pyrus communis]|uniref:uncharacterized protein n=1 Tax=Pyrus communis TaxID=23211 RepID=UPI0035BEE7C2
MKRELFESILNAVVNHYFERRVDATGRQGLSPHQKLTSAFRMLANGCSADSTDEYCRLAESTAIENLKRFCKAIEGIYGATYLRNPNRADLKRLLRKAEKKRLPWHDRKSRLYALGVEELSYWLGWPIQGPS